MLPLNIKKNRDNAKDKLVHKKEGETMAILNFFPEKNWVTKNKRKVRRDIRIP